MTQQLLGDLHKGIDQMGIKLPVSVPEKLIEYIGLLIHWNKAYNLTAVRDPLDMVSKHLLDSLAVLPFIGGGEIADVGSGAGLPGIPLALSMPDTRFTLIDSNGKKTRFLNQVKMVLKLENVDVIHQRAEDYSPTSDGIAIYFDTIIARAYANTQDILKSTAHLQNINSRVLVMQGKLDEALGLPGYTLKQAHVLNVHGLDAERHLLEIIKI